MTQVLLGLYHIPYPLLQHLQLGEPSLLLPVPHQSSGIFSGNFKPDAEATRMFDGRGEGDTGDCWGGKCEE